MKTKLLSIFALVMVSMLVVGFIPNGTDGWDIPEKYHKMKNTLEPTDENIQIGKKLYNQHCRSCHGTKGLADGPKAANMRTPMRSLADADYKAQSDGVKYYKSFIGQDEMPNFEKKIAEESDRWAVILYMETMK